MILLQKNEETSVCYWQSSHGKNDASPSTNVCNYSDPAHPVSFSLLASEGQQIQTAHLGMVKRGNRVL